MELKRKTTKEIINKCKSVFSRHGIPDEIIADNMPFNSDEMHNFAKEYNFTIKKGLIQTIFEPKPQLETNFKIATGNNSVRGQVRK